MRSLQLNKEGDCKCPNISLLQPQKRKQLQTDASIMGLGACLLQEGKPIYFTSKALTEAQKGYVAVELESLAVAWAMEQFHHLLYGNHFILETDQKLLEAILLKSLNQATPQLQRIPIRTFPYRFTVHHILGPINNLADCLSRLGTQNDSIKLPNLHLYQITNHLNARSDSLSQLHVTSQEDDDLVLLNHTIINGCLNTIKEVPNELQAYWTS